MLFCHFVISAFCVLNTPFKIKWLITSTLVSVEITLIFQYSRLSHLEHSFLILLWDVFAKRAVYFCLVFYNPFLFPGNFAEKCCWKLIFYPFFDPYLAKKISQNFLKCCKSNTTLPFVPYAKIKLMYCVVLKSDTTTSTFCGCFLSSLLLSLSLPHFCLILGIY